MRRWSWLNKHAGFTLIELLVVLVIMAIVLQFGWRQLVSRHPSARMQSVATQSQVFLQAMRQRAILVPQLLEVEVVPKGMKAWYYARHEWHPLRSGQYSAWLGGGHLQFALIKNKGQLSPRVSSFKLYCRPSGVCTERSVQAWFAHSNRHYQLQFHADGTTTVHPLSSGSVHAAA